MKTYEYELTPEDQRRLFFGTWYRDPRLMFRRILAGPVCLVFAVLCVVFQVGWVYVATGALLALVGLYYVFQPFLVFRGSGKEGLVATLTVAGDELRYEDRKVKAVIYKQMIVSLKVQGDFLMLGVRTDKVSYHYFDLGRIAGREEFLDKLKGMAGM